MTEQRKLLRELERRAAPFAPVPPGGPMTPERIRFLLDNFGSTNTLRKMFRGEPFEFNEEFEELCRIVRDDGPIDWRDLPALAEKFNRRKKAMALGLWKPRDRTEEIENFRRMLGWPSIEHKPAGAAGDEPNGN
jgi:hypothetical protein